MRVATASENWILWKESKIQISISELFTHLKITYLESSVPLAFKQHQISSLRDTAGWLFQTFRRSKLCYSMDLGSWGVFCLEFILDNGLRSGGLWMCQIISSWIFTEDFFFFLHTQTHETVARPPAWVNHDSVKFTLKIQYIETEHRSLGLWPCFGSLPCCRIWDWSGTSQVVLHIIDLYFSGLRRPNHQCAEM